jgi:hypothetical protein
MTSASGDSDISFAVLSTLLEKANLPPEEKRLIVARLWTIAETPSITSEAEYQTYSQRLKTYTIPDQDLDPDSWTMWTRTPVGMQAMAIEERILEWEQETAATNSSAVLKAPIR